MSRREARRKRLRRAPRRVLATAHGRPAAHQPSTIYPLASAGGCVAVLSFHMYATLFPRRGCQRANNGAERRLIPCEDGQLYVVDVFKWK